MPNSLRIYIPISTYPDSFELRCVSRLCEYFKSSIEFIPTGQNSSPDIYVKRLHQYWEIKNVRGNGKNTIHNILHDIERQSTNIVLTLYHSKMPPKTAIGRIKAELKKATRIKRVLLITKTEKVIAIKGNL